MKAFKIDWLNRQKARVLDLGYRYQFPRIECRHCEPEWGSWGDGMFEFPALQFDFLNETEFNFDRVVTLREFRGLKERIEQAAARPVNVIPGCAIGELAGQAFMPKLDDFVWGSILYPQISKRARDNLADDGIELTTAECSIRYRGRKIDSHLALQIEPVALLTEEGLQKASITRCQRCGQFKSPSPGTLLRHPGPRPCESEGYLIKRSAWPEGQHLVTMEETLDVLASPDFIEAVKRHNLKDIRFLECGRYV